LLSDASPDFAEIQHPELENAKFLHDLGPILWVIRFFLLAAFVTHIVATIQLAQESRLAKPQKYAVAHYERSTIASRTMLVSGLIVLFFVIYHILQFTLLLTDPRYHELHDSSGRHFSYAFCSCQGFASGTLAARAGGTE